MAFIKLPEGAAPSTPATGTVIIYAKADGYFYSKDDAGTETKLGAGIGLADANTFTEQQSFTGTAATAPAIAGASDPNTGVFFPAADTVGIATGGAERMRIDTSGNVLVTGATGLGYGTGAGGTVTQATDKYTAVTLNKPTGLITLNAAALGAGGSVSFDFNNSLIANKDVLLLTIRRGTGTAGAYDIKCDLAAGVATIYVKNITVGNLSEGFQINFNLFKGETS